VTAAPPSSAIRKTPAQGGVDYNLADYARDPASFSWVSARAELDGLPAGGLNIAHEAVSSAATTPGCSISTKSALRELRCVKALAMITGATHLCEEPGALDAVCDHAGVWFARHCPAATDRITHPSHSLRQGANDDHLY